jgi:hypothetical protein
LLAENHFEEPLPKNAFVFYMRQGYQIMFFHLGEDEDPPIYFFGEGRDSMRSSSCTRPSAPSW